MNKNIYSWHISPLNGILARRPKLPHALLLLGQTGIGKVEFARMLAQSLLCEAPDEGLACGHCPACHWFNEGNHPDYREVMPDSLKLEDTADTEGEPAEKAEKKSAQITIEQIRDLAQFVTLSTHRDGYRVLVIHPAEAMNAAAANALLKTLEEPTPRTMILLVADQPSRLLATVRSRCQKVLLPAPTEAQALDWLRIQAVAGADILLAQAGGAPLLAQQWADTGYQAQRKQFLTALAEPAKADWLGLAASLEKTDLTQVLYWLQTWCVDLVMQKQIGQARHHPDFAAALQRIAARADLTPLFGYESLLRQARRSIQHPLNARLLLEHLLLSYDQAVQGPTRYS